mmetsp:Transcript_4552/g.5878  ORF Transcript_4552/g.5878 Transcript_4552/m.5878 type:complete len:119 (+) Transcript_4552:136-492(+)
MASMQEDCSVLYYLRVFYLGAIAFFVVYWDWHAADWSWADGFLGFAFCFVGHFFFHLGRIIVSFLIYAGFVIVSPPHVCGDANRLGDICFYGCRRRYFGSVLPLAVRGRHGRDIRRGG